MRRTSRGARADRWALSSLTRLSARRALSRCAWAYRRSRPSRDTRAYVLHATAISAITPSTQGQRRRSVARAGTRVPIAGVCLAMIAVPEVVAWGLVKRYYWAWVAGIVIFAIYAPSLFFILGGLGLWGLLDEGSRAQFRQG
jgi:hypothetical protein